MFEPENSESMLGFTIPHGYHGYIVDVIQMLQAAGNHNVSLLLQICRPSCPRDQALLSQRHDARYKNVTVH